ncbi:MAG: rhodanese-like domain-containing protein [Anaerovoracaceae bacterium]
MKYYFLIAGLVIAIAVGYFAISNNNSKLEGKEDEPLCMSCVGNREKANTAKYHKVEAETAKRMMDNDSSLVILDVRTQGEYDEGHIKDATLIPVDGLEAVAEEKFPDKKETILVYCRSGNRSKDAADILVEKGYTKVYDFGGIKDWPYEIEK